MKSTVELRCENCPSCCRCVCVPLTTADLGRLVAATGLPGAEIVDWTTPEQIDMTGEPETFVETSRGRVLMVLRHVDGGCRFLSTAGLCSVYEVRPAPCAAYPFASSRKGDRRALEVLSGAPCKLDAVLATHLDASCLDAQEVAARAVARVETELNAYIVQIAEWNRRQKRRVLAGHRARTANEFLQFLGF